MIKPEITYGDIIVIVITLPALIILVWQGITYWSYRIRPFRMWFQEELKWKGERKLSKHRTISVGTAIILLRVQPRRPTSFNRIHLRLLDKKRLNSLFPKREDVSITDLKLYGEGLFTDYTPHDVQLDYTNGLQENLLKDWHCASEDSLYIEATIKANKKWSGYILFQSIRSDGHRGCEYLPLQVSNKEGRNESSGESKPTEPTK